jgi:predicted  nucleic acid-binding Zn-ribbon protein
MTYQQPTAESSGSPVLRAIGGFFRFLIRLIFILIVGALVGAGLYYGVPWAYRNLVQPVQQNTVHIAALEQRMAQEQTRLQDENLALQERIAALEAEMTALREQSAVQTQDIDGTAEQIQQLELRLTQVEGDLEAHQEAVEIVRSQLDSSITDLSEQADQAAEQTGELEGRLALLQTAQDLLRVHVLLLEDNSRSARDTLMLATAHSEQAATLMPEQKATLLELQGRMARLEQLIVERSFRAGPELESLWADVMDLVLPPALSPAGELTPGAPAEPTPTPTP